MRGPHGLGTINPISAPVGAGPAVPLQRTDAAQVNIIGVQPACYRVCAEQEPPTCFRLPVTVKCAILIDCVRTII
jgi:hypothetical protein